MANVKISDLTGAAATTAGQEFEVNDALTSKKVTASQVSSFVLSNLSSADLVTLGVTASAAELNILDGVTSTTAELNILDGVTSTAAELNILDGVTASTAEINHLVGVTSPIQTQIDNATPFNPTTVTGATPSLDLGSFNFFANGTLTGDTTVTFASVPTEARWTYAFGAINLDAWDVSAGAFLQSFSVSAQDSSPQSVFFKPDGTKIYVLGGQNDEVFEYALITAWDIPSAVFLTSVTVFSQASTPTGLFFKPDGTKMYVTGTISDSVHEYDLSRAWDVSSAVSLQSLSVNTQEASPTGVFFKPDGTKMYVIGRSGTEVNEYNLSTAWDISSATFLQLFSVATQEASPEDVFFKPDGTKMYVVGASGDEVNEYSLSTAWDVSSATFLQVFSVATQTTAPRGFFFKPDGTKMYVMGSSVYEYDIGASAAVTLPASVQNPPTEFTSTGAQVAYEFYTLDGGTTVYLINEEVLL